VSRIEFVAYNFPVSGLPHPRVDAAINPGNSGGPAIAGDKMIGLAFSKAGGDTQNIGYIIPNEEVDLFLKDIADGHYDGKPAMYDEFANAGKSGVARVSQAGQVCRGNGRSPSRQVRGVVPTQGMGCPDPHRRHSHR